MISARSSFRVSLSKPVVGPVLGPAIGLAVGVLAITAAAHAQQDPPIDQMLRAAADAAGLPEGVTITRGVVDGSKLPMLTVSKQHDGDRPTILVVAGTDGRHSVGQLVAVNVARSIAVNHTDILDSVDVVILPNIDPATAWLMQPKMRVDAGMFSTRLTGAADDIDGDGRLDEDGPNDMDGDGSITMMRIMNPPATIKREWIIDPDDSRIMRKPKKDEGEIPTHAMLIESIDDDNDGKYAEDAPGSIVVDKHFPYLWPEFSSGAGRFPLEDANARALADYVVSNMNIVAVVAYSPSDTVTKIPAAGKFDPSGRVPTGIEKGDEDLYTYISEAFGEITHIKSTHDVIDAGFGKGSFAGWTYAHMGIPTFATPVWVRPDLLDDKESKKADDKDTDTDEHAAEDSDEHEESDEPTSVFIGGKTIALTENDVATALDWLETLDTTQSSRAAMDIMQLPTDVREKLGSLTPTAVKKRAEEEEAKTKKEAEKEAAKIKGEADDSESGKDENGDASDDSEADDAPKVETIEISGRSIELSTEGIQSAMSEMESMSDAERRDVMEAFMAMPEDVRQKFMTVAQGGTLDQPEADDTNGEETPGEDGKAKPKKSGKGDKKKKKTDDEKWFEYLDTFADEDGNVPGFVAWKEFDHPQLGTVEIGGMSPGAMLHPQAHDFIEYGVLHGRLVDQQAAFIAKIYSMLPDVTVHEPVVEVLGNGVWRIDLRIVNTGQMATTSAIGVKTRRWPRTMVRLDMPRERVLSGNRVSGFDSLAGLGGEWTGTWVVIAEGMDSVKIHIEGPAVPAMDIEATPTSDAHTGGDR